MSNLNVYQKPLDMSDPMPEYRLIYHWDAEHWTCITTGDIIIDIRDYVEKHLAEMQDGMEVSEDAYYSIVYYYNNAPMAVWHGTPQELLENTTELVNAWLDRAFQ